MAQNILFEVTPLNGATPKTLRMAGAFANASGTQLNGYGWSPLVTKRNSGSLTYAVEGLLSEPQLSNGSISFRMGAAYENEAWSKYEWNTALARIFIGTLGDPFTSYKQVFEGSVSGLSRDGVTATLELLGSDALLNRPMLSLEYQGTGGAEGPVAFKGKLKPRAFGSCISVSADDYLVDPAKYIYQVHGYGSCTIDAVFEFAQSLGTPVASVADYAALAGLTLKPGQWAKCEPLGMFRLGGRPDKKVSADITAGPTTVGTIVPAMIQLAGIPSAKIGSFAAFSDKTWSLYQTDQADIGDVARNALYQAGGVLFADGTGTWQTMDYFAPKTPVVLNADRSSLPLVKSYKLLPVADPIWKVKIGYDRVWGVHSTSDVSPAFAEIAGNNQAILDAAQAAREAAEQAAADALVAEQRLDAIEADGILDRSEKAEVIRLFGAATAEHPMLLSKGSATPERLAYSNAYDALAAYLSGLSPAYTDGTQDTPIDRVAFDKAWTDFYVARSALYSSLSTWAGTIGDGKPEDNATVGAPVGTDVAGVPAQTVVENAQNGLNNANAIRHQLPDLVGPLLREPIDRLSALTLEYGTSSVKLAQALNKENLVAISTLKTRVEEDGSKVAESFLQLTSRLSDAEKAVAGIDIKGPIEAGLSELRRTIANANYASSEVVDIKIANYGDGVTAWQTNEERVRAEKDKAFAEDIDKMGVRITTEVDGVKTTLEGSFNDLRDIVIEDGEATAKRIDEMGTRITLEVDGVTKAYEGAIKTVEETLAKDGEVTAKRIDTISSSVDGLTGPNGIIQTIQDTEARNDGARAQETKSLQSRLDNFNGASLEQKFSTYANKTDGIGAQYVLKVQTDVNGVKSIAGMGIAVDDNVSAIAFTADSFRLTTPGSFPQQIFYADANGVYMRNVTVDKLTYGALVDQFAKTSSTNDPNGGYIQIPGGPMYMWGRYRAAIRGEVSLSIEFPIPFPTMCWSFVATPYITVPNYRKDLWVQNTGSPSRFGSTVYTQAATGDDQYLDGFDWMAVGI